VIFDVDKRKTSRVKFFKFKFIDNKIGKDMRGKLNVSWIESFQACVVIVLSYTNHRFFISTNTIVFVIFVVLFFYFSFDAHKVLKRKTICILLSSRQWMSAFQCQCWNTLNENISSYSCISFVRLYIYWQRIILKKKIHYFVRKNLFNMKILIINLMLQNFS